MWTWLLFYVGILQGCIQSAALRLFRKILCVPAASAITNGQMPLAPIFNVWLIQDLMKLQLTKIIEPTVCFMGPIFRELWTHRDPLLNSGCITGIGSALLCFVCLFGYWKKFIQQSFKRGLAIGYLIWEAPLRLLSSQGHSVALGKHRNWLTMTLSSYIKVTVTN